MDHQRSKEILQEKQKLYIKFLKTKTLEEEFKYKTYKSLFKKLREKAKITYYSKLLHKYEEDSKRIWHVMKEITGKQKIKSNILPQQIKVDKTIIQINKTLLNNSTNLLLLMDQNC